MNRPTSLLAHLAPRLTSGTENLATEALLFILLSSPSARQAIRSFLLDLLHLDPSEPDWSWFSQAVDSDGTIPDLAVLDPLGTPRLFIEVKFWAGLTEAQPVQYLERLKRSGGAAVLFLVPENRVGTLWPELLTRCEGAKIEPVSDSSSTQSSRLVRLRDLPSLAVTSWNTVLTHLSAATASAHDAQASEDLRQLASLCDQMEVSGFIPMTSEEITGLTARRIEDYCGLVDDLVNSLNQDGLASTKGLRSAGGRATYCRYVLLKGNPAQLIFEPRLWSRYGRSPIWLVLLGEDWRPTRTLSSVFVSYLSGEQPRAIEDGTLGLVFPLRLTLGRERPDVLDALGSQVREITGLLSAGHGTPPPADGVA